MAYLNPVALDIESDSRVSSALPSPIEDDIISLALIPRPPAEGWVWYFQPDNDAELTRTGIHGMTRQSLEEKGAGLWVDGAREVAEEISKATHLLTYSGAAYDIPLLEESFARAGVMITLPPVIDLAVLWRKHERRTLDAAVSRFLGLSHDQAHTADADAAVLHRLCWAMAVKFGLQVDYGILAGESVPVVELAGTVYRKIHDGKLGVSNEGKVVYLSQRALGVPVAEDRGYGYWMLTQDWVSTATKQRIREEFQRADQAAAGGVTPSKRGKKGK